MKHFGSAAAMLAMAGVLTACSVNEQVRVATPQLESLPDTLVIDPGDNPTGSQARFAARLQSRLVSQGIAVHKDATYRLAIALSAQNASIGVTSDPGKNPKAIDWKSRPRKGSLFDGCKPQRLRAVVIGSRGLTALIGLRAEAEMDSCKDIDAGIDRLADALVDAIRRR